MRDFLGSFLSQWRETGSSRVWAREIKHLLQLFLQKNLFLSPKEALKLAKLKSQENKFRKPKPRNASSSSGEIFLRIECNINFLLFCYIKK